MPLMAAYEQNDARDTARLLASMTLEGLRRKRQDALVGNAIDNMFRLLQGYRAHGFYGCIDEQRPEEEKSMTSLLTDSDRNVGDLKHALDVAFRQAFEGQDAGQAIEGMRETLRIAAFPRDGDAPDEGETARAEAFFATLVRKLEA